MVWAVNLYDACSTAISHQQIRLISVVTDPHSAQRHDADRVVVRKGQLPIFEDPVDPKLPLVGEVEAIFYRMLWFEADDPETWPTEAMAAVTTHDLATVAGLWDGSDLDEQRRLGLAPNEAGIAEMRERLAAAGGLADGASTADAVLAAHRLLGRTPSLLRCATLDDALAVPERPNVPGADDQRPNWSLALPVPIDDLADDDLARAVATAVSPRPPRGVPRP